MSEESKNDTIDVFGGWENPDDNFLTESFSEEPTNTETTKIVKEVLNDDIIEIDNENQEEQEKNDKLADDTFSDWIDSKDDVKKDEEEEEQEQQETLTSKNIEILNTLKEKGLIHYELEEGEELTDELAAELIEDNFDSTIETKVGEKIKDLPESIKNLIKYSLNGGNPDDLIAQMASKPTNNITDKSDITDPKIQEAVVRSAMKEKGEDDENIDSYIEFLKDSNKLEGVSKKEFDAVIAKKKDFTKQQADAQEARKLAIKEKQRKFRNELVEFISDKDVPVKLTKQEQKDLPAYMADTTVQLENGNKISKMQSDLFNALADKEKALKLAKLLKNNFDFTDFIQDEKTRIVKTVKGKVEEGKRNRSSQPKESKSLADWLTE